jgi:hypothetical protein
MRLHHHGEQSNPSQPCSRAEKPVIRPVFRLSKRIPIPVFERDFKPRVLLGDGAFYKFSLATRVSEVVITLPIRTCRPFSAGKSVNPTGSSTDGVSSQARNALVILMARRREVIASRRSRGEWSA